MRQEQRDGGLSSKSFKSFKNKGLDIETILAELQELNRERPVIVEGQKDESALRNLGLNGTILRINIGIPLFTFCERLKPMYREVILLTDWDRRGNELCKLLKHHLEANNIKYNMQIRNALRIISGKEIRCVEDLPGWVKRHEDTEKRDPFSFDT